MIAASGAAARETVRHYVETSEPPPMNRQKILFIISLPFRLLGGLIGYLMLEIARLAMRIAGIFIKQA